MGADVIAPRREARREAMEFVLARYPDRAERRGEAVALTWPPAMPDRTFAAATVGPCSDRRPRRAQNSSSRGSCGRSLGSRERGAIEADVGSATPSPRLTHRRTTPTRSRCRDEDRERFHLFETARGTVWLPVFPAKMRRGWDSNPRKPCGFSGFQDRRIRPLCHPSEAGSTGHGRKVRLPANPAEGQF